MAEVESTQPPATGEPETIIDDGEEAETKVCSSRVTFTLS